MFFILIKRRNGDLALWCGDGGRRQEDKKGRTLQLYVLEWNHVAETSMGVVWRLFHSARTLFYNGSYGEKKRTRVSFG